ncbi:MAG: hypothetical protein WB424_18555 [Terracidiphilus sp.]
MDWKKWFPVIFSAFIFVILSIAILNHDLWSHHDSTSLLLHLSLLLNMSVLIGVMLWLSDRWKYFGFFFWLIFEVFTLGQIIQYLNKGSFWQMTAQVFVFLCAAYFFRKEFIKFLSLLKSKRVESERDSI